MLEAGYFLNNRAFFGNLPTILIYAVVVSVLEWQRRGRRKGGGEGGGGGRGGGGEGGEGEKGSTEEGWRDGRRHKCSRREVNEQVQ